MSHTDDSAVLNYLKNQPQQQEAHPRVVNKSVAGTMMSRASSSLSSNTKSQEGGKPNAKKYALIPDNYKTLDQ
ncbi:hypothetical protein FRX31_002853, partial [Thalictrum thalictroides]